MYPNSIEYYRAGSLAEAIALLSENEGAKILAGGHSLLPAMNLRLADPGTLVDIGRISELKTITVNGDVLSIGALCTHAQIAASPEVQTHCPALAAACGQVGDPQVRNWGTLGGNLAHADPASDPPTVVLACGGTIHVQGLNGERAIPADDFFLDLFTVALEPGELITRIDLPSLRGLKSAYAKMAHPASRYAVVGVCVVLDMDGANCRQARVAIGGATAKATRATNAETALSGAALDDAALDKAAQAITMDVGSDPMSDIYASGQYRTAMAGVYLKRAIRAALA
ncbi:MAG: xanthine dehydrogenase family protein subunit M [Anaerolineae bacterium]|nr:xanthine dehydrogenase family protein subunit M [Anaerolineae bacterium]